ncbi:MAG: RloB family protein [Chitinophagales bacterium]|jgi:hypothetical protein|nr:RloB family protein [Sphingobacteriales bacterium]
MKSRRNPSKGKIINPKFWVFCEGETEEAYISLLRRKYRFSSLEIIPKVAHLSIDNRFINAYKRDKFLHENDKTFLVYDIDNSDILARLQSINSAIIIGSNPSIELWFLLHYKAETANITVEKCIRELSNRNSNIYKKGKIDNKLEFKLTEKICDAIKRSKTLKVFDNPSTSFHIFIDELDKIKK